MNKFFSDRQFIKNLAYLAIPIILNELLNSAVNMLDTFMVGTLGDAPVAAVGLGNQVFFLFTVVAFGINSGTAIFMGQYMGKNDLPNVHRSMGLAFILTFLTACIFAIAATIFPENIMRIYSKDSQVIEMGVGYLRTVAVAYLFTAITLVFNYALKISGNTVQPMLTTLCSFLINFVANYFFIFIMDKGVTGAALGTVVARSCELVIQFIAMVRFKRVVLTKPADYFKLDLKFCKPFVGITIPVILNESIWAFGTTAYNVAYKYSGTVAQAAVQIASTVQSLFMVTGLGIGAACAVILTNTLGAGDKQRAKEDSHRCMFFGILMSIIMGCVLALASPLIVSIFKVDEVARSYALKMLFAVAVAIVIKTANYVNICGILRSGGDTAYCLILDAASVWFVGLPIAFIGSAVLGLPIYVTFSLVYMEEAVKLIFSTKRVMSNKWLRTLV